MQHETPANDRAELTAELEIWRKRMFRRLTPARDQFPELYLLATGAEHPEGPWSRSDYPPIRTLLIQAIDHAEKLTESSQPVDAYSPTVLRRIFGLTEETANATVRERQKAAVAVIPDVYTHYEMTEPEVRGPQVHALITAIDGWCTARSAAQLGSATHGQSAGNSSGRLVGRGADLEWLNRTRNQLKDTGGLFGIWGLEGIGKTALAEQFAWTIGPARAATIRVGQPGRYAEDLRAALTKAGHAVPDADTEAYEAAFRRHAGSLGDLWLLILDGVTGPDDIDRLGLDQPGVPVLVVASERFTAGHAEGREDVMAWRQIGPLDAEAGLQLLAQHMPDTTIDRDARADLEELAALTGGHAATLHALGQLLPTLSAEDIGELLRVGGHAPGESLASVSRFTGDRDLRMAARPLSWIVRSKLAELADEPVALTVLTILVTCSESGTLRREIIEAVAAEMLRRKPWSRELDFAYDRLTQLGLVARRDTELSTERLICQITRHEIIDRLPDALLAYERVAAGPSPTDAERFTPVGFLRAEYAAASHLGRGHETLLATRQNARFLRIGPAADNYWAQYLTNEEGRRRVHLYRPVGHDSILSFSANGLGWTQVEVEEFRDLITAWIDRYFYQIITVQLVAFEREFGPDQRQWPPEVLDMLESTF